MSHMRVAQSPPMGWNSFDCYATNAFEDEIRRTAEYMAEHLLEFGWEYVCIDARWYDPAAAKTFLFEIAPFEIDGFGRPLPAINRFPSAVDGCGFKPLADYVHSIGLKFGIHIMRGVPRKSAHLNTPVLGTRENAFWESTDRIHGPVGAAQGYLGAAGIANGKEYTCDFCQDMYGVKPEAPGAYEWYRSLIEQYAAWGIDLIKVDNISKHPYSEGEIELVRRAIDEVGRPIVLSLSPGATPIEKADHVKQHGNMWRISSDFWDTWDQLYRNFAQCALWAPHAGPGHWPDADMLPLGKLCVHSRRQTPRWTRFTEQEQRTLMTLWSIARSPLILGGQLWDNDAFTHELITNSEVLRVNQTAVAAHELVRENDLVSWVAHGLGGERYLAHFNLTDEPATVLTLVQDVEPQSGELEVRDLWSRSSKPLRGESVESRLEPHGCALYRVADKTSR